MNESVEELLQKVGNGEVKPWDACLLMRAETRKDLDKFKKELRESKFGDNPVAMKGFSMCGEVVTSEEWGKLP